MSGITNAVDKNLDTIISKKLHIQPVLAQKWQWRILNEYPEDLKNVIRKWAMDEEVPEIEYDRITLKMAMKGIGLNILEAADLLYIISKDPLQGYEIFSKSVHR